MKLFPATLSAVPLLLLSSFLSLAPLATEAATGRDGPSHFIIETPSSKSPWKADSVNPLVWTYSKSTSEHRRAGCWERSRRREGAGEARADVDDDPSSRRRSRPERARAACELQLCAISGFSGALAVGPPWLRLREPQRTSFGAEGRAVTVASAPAVAAAPDDHVRTRRTDLPISRNRPASILQFDVELLRLSGTGLLLVAKNGQSEASARLLTCTADDRRRLRVQCPSSTARPSSPSRTFPRATTTSPSSWTLTTAPYVLARLTCRPSFRGALTISESYRTDENPVAHRFFRSSRDRRNSRSTPVRSSSGANDVTAGRKLIFPAPDNTASTSVEASLTMTITGAPKYVAAPPLAAQPF